MLMPIRENTVSELSASVYCFVALIIPAGTPIITENSSESDISISVGGIIGRRISVTGL
jgi:hypothetical protein